jgi:Na+/H+ antiporter NhaA
MGVVQRKLTKTFNNFFDSEKSSGILLILCTIVSLALTNSILGENYLSIWHAYVSGLSFEHWINDGLMAIFFLFIGWSWNVSFTTASCRISKMRFCRFSRQLAVSVYPP